MEPVIEYCLRKIEKLTFQYSKITMLNSSMGTKKLKILHQTQNIYAHLLRRSGVLKWCAAHQTAPKFPVRLAPRKQVRYRTENSANPAWSTNTEPARHCWNHPTQSVSFFLFIILHIQPSTDCHTTWSWIKPITCVKSNIGLPKTTSECHCHCPHLPTHPVRISCHQPFFPEELVLTEKQAKLLWNMQQPRSNHYPYTETWMTQPEGYQPKIAVPSNQGHHLLTGTPPDQPITAAGMPGPNPAHPLPHTNTGQPTSHHG